MKKITYGLLLGVIFCTSCDPFGFNGRSRRPEPPAEVDGWAPVYNTDQSATIIRSEDPREIVKGGKIYLKNDTLYQVEVGKGVHLIDISQPSAPRKLQFIAVLGAQEMAIKDNYLYTNNMNDLVVVDIRNLGNVKLADRISNVFHLVDKNYPPASGYYECVDPNKGDVIGWEQKVLNYPQCQY